MQSAVFSETGDLEQKISRQPHFVELTIAPDSLESYEWAPGKPPLVYRKRCVDVSKIVAMERMTYDNGDVKFGRLLKHPYTQLWFDSGFTINVVEDINTILEEIGRGNEVATHTTT
jgi:hypothetical protein